MDVIEVDGLTIAYERVGHGPPLVLLHGYVGDGPTTWRSQLEGLSDEFTVVAWDAPGAGRSSDPPEEFGMCGYADCLARFISGLGFRAPHVAGLFFGGALALAFNQRHPATASPPVSRSRIATVVDRRPERSIRLCARPSGLPPLASPSRPPRSSVAALLRHS